MKTDIWDRGVELVIDGKDEFRTVSNTREAVECLMTSWPDEKGPAYATARKACLSALDGEPSDIDPRAAFIAAAGECGILRTS
ncbi:DUF982 domain-containing protein [Rhizobium tibeticum]|uniref:DUF982 domain-containing protein n=1 Tax=Rhizobium tibeticum TaxID=501024 RepID=UPI0027D7B315|nr:DUF982 domain-containing protein [Rhizobium tibeticum]